MRYQKPVVRCDLCNEERVNPEPGKFERVTIHELNGGYQFTLDLCQNHGDVKYDTLKLRAIELIRKGT